MGRPAIPQASRRRLNDAVDRLGALLPVGWQLTVERRSAEGGVIRVGDDRDSIDIAVITRDRIEPRDIDRLQLSDQPTIVSAAWLSPRTRELLRARGVGFVDRTGNTELCVQRPGLYLRTDGSDRDPAPRPKPGPSLNGPRAWALLRTLVEVSPLYTAGDLASALKLDNGYITRALQVLTDEQLIERRPRGPVTSVEWEPLLRRLIESYSLLDANTTSTWIAAAGPSQLLDDLADLRVGTWAVTGSFVASAIAPVAAAEIAVLYTADPERLAKAARLLPATTGSNVILAVPYDPIVFQRTQTLDQVQAVSVAQAAMDSLTGPGRMPSEGEALLTWMRRNEPRWRGQNLKA